MNCIHFHFTLLRSFFFSSSIHFSLSPMLFLLFSFVLPYSSLTSFEPKFVVVVATLLRDSIESLSSIVMWSCTTPLSPLHFSLFPSSLSSIYIYLHTSLLLNLLHLTHVILLCVGVDCKTSLDRLLVSLPYGSWSWSNQGRVTFHESFV